MSEFLSKSDILGFNDVVTEEVVVPEWGGRKVRVMGLTGRGRDDYEAAILDQRGKKTRVNMRNARARLVALTVVDERGERIFSDDDIPMLGQKNAAALDRIFDVARRLSGLSDEDVEELEGNSAGTPSGDSPSA